MNRPGTKWRTLEALVESAQKCQTKGEWQTNDRNAYMSAITRRATKPWIWEKCTAHMGVERSNKAAEVRSRIKLIAARYATKKEWRLGDAESYQLALRWRRSRPDEWQACTSHMTVVRAKRANESYCKIRYTDDAIRTSALRFTTKTEWYHGDRPCYEAARARRKTRPEYFADITSHMVPASFGPYLGTYYAYACLFTKSKVCYPGISYRAEHLRKKEHAEFGPVCCYARSTRESFEWIVLERAIANPVLAGVAEFRWWDRYAALGWTMLTPRWRCGNLGLTLGRKNKSRTNKAAALAA